MNLQLNPLALPKAAKIANKTDIFYPGQTLVCTVDSYPLLPVSWNKLSAPSCQNPPSSMPQGLGMATLTLTSKCLGQQTWSCTATWIDLVTVVNDTITFTGSLHFFVNSTLHLLQRKKNKHIKKNLRE